MNKNIKRIGIILILIVIGSAVLIILQKPTEKNLITPYKITLDVNGRASVLETDEKGMLEEPDIPYGARDKFLGWYIGDEKVDFSKPFTENSTIRAKWER